MTQEQKDRLRDIINAGAKGMTADVRAFVRDLAEENGIEIKNTRCKDCHIDAAVALLRLDREKETGASAEENDDRRYVLRPGVDVYFGMGMQPGALPFPRKELSPREALAVCTPPAPKPSARTPGS